MHLRVRAPAVGCCPSARPAAVFVGRAHVMTHRTSLLQRLAASLIYGAHEPAAQTPRKDDMPTRSPEDYKPRPNGLPPKSRPRNRIISAVLSHTATRVQLERKHERQDDRRTVYP
jgi:hypothetical protein